MVSKVLEWVGTVIGAGRYEITAKVGEGGMGYVYRARDANLETDVIIKVPRRAMLEDPEFAERFAREIRSLVRLSHPHIVNVIDVGVHDATPFAVMQYLSGGSLESRHADRPDDRVTSVDPHSLRQWLPSIASALDFTHGQGYVHRDVKPANILFDAHGNAYLSDFGIAKALAAAPQSNRAASLTGTGMVLGTPHYMAPELVLGQQVDGRVDQYALAVAVHELLTGGLPIDGPTPAAILVQQATQAPLALRDLAKAFDGPLTDAVLKALAKTPGDRFATCSEFADAVLAAVALMPSGSPIVPVAQKEPPKPITSRATSPGRVPCPNCGAVLVLKSQHGGRRARCHKCASLLIISQDSCELTLANPVADSTPVNSTMPTVGQAAKAGAQQTAWGSALRFHWPWRTFLPRLIDGVRRRRRATLLATGGVIALCCAFVGWTVYRSAGTSHPEDGQVGWRSQLIGPEGIPNQYVTAGNKLQLDIRLDDTAPQKEDVEFGLIGKDTPAGTTIDPTSGHFEWTPTEGQEGDYMIAVDARSRRDGQHVAGFVFKVTVRRGGKSQPSAGTSENVLPIDEPFNNSKSYMMLGDASTSNGELELANGLEKASAVWFNTPIPPGEWTATFEFTIDHRTGWGWGDGFTFAVIDANQDPIEETLGETGTALGYAGPSALAVNSGFAIEFDNYRNSVSEPDYAHVGLDVRGSVDSLAVSGKLPQNSLEDRPIHAEIKFDDQGVQVFLANDRRPSTQVLNAPLPPGAFPVNPRVGFTAGTGKAGQRVRIDNFRLVRGLSMAADGGAGKPLRGQNSPSTCCPDPSFGRGGIATFDAPEGQQDLEAIALQSDGRIVCVGGYDADDFIVVRYNADGSLDQSFGTAGCITTDFGGRKDRARAVGIQADGKIVVGGSANDGVDFALARYKPDGTLDDKFGASGKVLVDFGSNNLDMINDLVIHPDGRILAVGQSTPTPSRYPTSPQTFFALARFDVDGDLDATFGTNGTQQTDFGPSADVIQAVALDSRGKILAAGYTGGVSGPMAMALARYDSHGELDESFGSAGKVTTDIGNLDEAAFDVIVQSDGRIVLAGNTTTHNGYHFALVRYQTNGDVDPGFGAAGVVTTDFGRANSGAVAVAIQYDERIVAVGLTGNNAFGLARYETNGSLDQRFGNGGKLIATIDGFSFAQPSSLAIQKDGRIAVGGFARDSTGDRFALARFLAPP